jgi:sialidase-1
MNRRDLLLGGLAAVAGRATAQEGEDGVFERVVCPATSSRGRKTEAAMIQLRDGTLLLAYTEFYTVSPEDDSPARIRGKHSRDLGKTWSEPFTIVENTAGMNVMSVSLLRLDNGELALVYMFKESHEDCSVLLRRSRDEGRTFGDPVSITPRKSFWVMNNDRLVQLRSGRLLAPCQRLDNWPKVRHSLTIVLYSDDRGSTWRESELVDIRNNNDGADEPGVVELAGGRIMMYFRTDLGSVYQCFSSDSGASWSKPEPAKLEAPVSPAIIKRIPSTGHLLIVWNHTLPHRRGGHTDRFPLTAAISRDEARTWERIRDVETDVRYTYAYPSLTFIGNRVLVTYWSARDWAWWVSLKLKSLPVSWFYEDTQEG